MIDYLPYLFGIIAVLYLIFTVIREALCWYYKTNEIISILQNNTTLLQDNANILQKTANSADTIIKIQQDMDSEGSDMTQDNGKIWILDAIHDFVEEHGRDPTTVRIDLSTAYDLMKLGAGDIGEELAGAFLSEGIGAFKTRKFFGFTLTVDPQIEDIVCE